jgi:hypothetical protein
MKKTLLLNISLFLISSTIFSQDIMFNKAMIDASAGNEPYTIASGNLDGDAYLDIAIATYTGSTVSWYKNNGDGTFAAKISLVATGPNALSYIESITIGDINNDGYDDILATGSYNNNLVWFENNGDETFEPAVLISSALSAPGKVLTANIDNDSNGYLDVIVSEYYGNKVSYFLGNGDGTFGAKREIFSAISGSGPASFDFADYDNDGDLDVVVGFTANGEIKLYDNKLVPDGLDVSGDVPFDAYTNNVDTGNGWLWTVIFGDINNDGNLDIIKSDSEPTSGNTAIAWFTNDTSGTGTTFTKTTITTSFTHGGDIRVKDLDDDGYNDFIVSNSYASGADLAWFEGNASGGLGTEIVIGDDTSPSMFSISVQDFDNDSDLDIAGISYLNDDVFVFFNEPTIGISEYNFENISIYPNPTSDFIKFKGITSETVNVSVYDILGKQIINQTINTNKSLDVSNLQNGIYILRLDDLSTSYKFVKE